jgi:hypothetical protein
LIASAQLGLALSKIAMQVRRRVVTRSILVLGAALVVGQVMRDMPRDQTLVFPVGSVFPNATRFAASWKRQGDREPHGGVSLTFNAAAPLQIRQHATLPDGDYIVTLEIAEDPPAGEMARRRAGLQTSIERRVSLGGGETLIALTPSPPAEHL